MSRQNSEARPFTYGYMASSNCPQPGLKTSQGHEPDLPDSSGTYAAVSPSGENQSAYQRNLQQHPDGPGFSNTREGQKETLNFGWFSLPRSRQGNPTDEDRLKSPAAAGGGVDGIIEPEPNQRPSSKGSHRPDSRQKTPSQQGREYPPGNLGMGEPANSYEAGHAVHEPTGPGYTMKQPLQPIYEENMVIDWPISVLAQGNMPRLRNAPQTPNQPRTPATRPIMHSDVPPTPMPPLQWQGYQNSGRPTYASWHDYWHRNSNMYPQNGDKDANNSNNQMDNSLTSSESSSANIFDPNSSFGDSNNNNWLISNECYSSPGRQVMTLPPYEPSSPVIPRFYSPNVVMKWEDADNQVCRGQDTECSKQAPLTKRIRSAFFHMWSTLSCLKSSHTSADVTEGSGLFKYDRFGHDNNTLCSN